MRGRDKQEGFLSSRPFSDTTTQPTDNRFRSDSPIDLASYEQLVPHKGLHKPAQQHSKPHTHIQYNPNAAFRDPQDPRGKPAITAQHPIDPQSASDIARSTAEPDRRPLSGVRPSDELELEPELDPKLESSTTSTHPASGLTRTQAHALAESQTQPRIQPQSQSRSQRKQKRNVFERLTANAKHRQEENKLRYPYAGHTCHSTQNAKDCGRVHNFETAQSLHAESQFGHKHGSGHKSGRGCGCRCGCEGNGSRERARSPPSPSRPPSTADQLSRLEKQLILDCMKSQKDKLSPERSCVSAYPQVTTVGECGRSTSSRRCSPGT
jgi:hypothetical protein